MQSLWFSTASQVKKRKLEGDQAWLVVVEKRKSSPPANPFTRPTRPVCPPAAPPRAAVARPEVEWSALPLPGTVAQKERTGERMGEEPPQGVQATGSRR